MLRSVILEEIDQALAHFSPAQGRPVAIELGERKYTQLILDVASLHADGGDLTTNTGLPRPGNPARRRARGPGTGDLELRA